jgi:glycosyltransferase involved in cell wall biosynthesis
MSEPTDRRRVSVIVPALDEAPSLEPLYQELAATCEAEALDAQLIFVDDGSKDETWSVIESLSQRDERVVGLRLRRNFGKTAALAAALEEADADIVCMLDADGQDDPAELGRCLRRLDEGHDVVNGWKRERKDPLSKRAPSRLFNIAINAMSGMRLHDHNCGLKVVRREVFDEVQLYGNLHRFIPVLAHSRGFRVTEEAVAHRARRHGRSKYGASRFVTGLLDLLLVRFLTDYRGRPQHLLGTVGLFTLLVGAAALGWLAFTWLSQFWWPEAYKPIASRPLTLYALGALLVGAQLVSLGVLAGLLPATSASSKEQYSLRERRGRAKDQPRLRTVRGG